MKVLLTGFVPFGKHKVNPSEEVVKRLADSRIEGVELATAILAVHPKEGLEKLMQVFEESKPEAVLLLGESGGYASPTLERVFVNILEYPAELGEGVAVNDQVLEPNGPTAYFTTLPYREIQERVLKAGLPIRLSLTAGTYICNQVGYVILNEIHRRKQRIPAGLIHLPFLPMQAATLAAVAAYPSMPLEILSQVVSLAIETIVQRKAPIL